MLTLPPLPGWDGLHPLIVHFPVALLLVAPLFILVGAFLKTSARVWFLAALLLMALGTAATFVAVPTGEAAARLAERTDEMAPVLIHHQELAEATRMVFAGLTVLLLAGLLVTRRRTPGRAVSGLLLSGFLVLYAGAALLLSNTSHSGGRLVHQYGVRALVVEGSPPPVETP